MSVDKLSEEQKREAYTVYRIVRAIDSRTKFDVYSVTSKGQARRLQALFQGWCKKGTVYMTYDRRGERATFLVRT